MRQNFAISNLQLSCHRLPGTDDNEDKKMLMRYDSYTNEMVLLSEDEVSFLQRQIQKDLANCEQRIFIHNRNISKPPIKSTDPHDRFEWQNKCQEWYKGGIELQYENDALVDWDDIISDIVESGVHNGIRTDYPDDTCMFIKVKSSVNGINTVLIKPRQF